LVLDMLIGDPIGFTVAARRHHVHHRKARRELIAAIDRWPQCKVKAYRPVDEEDFNRINSLIMQGIGARYRYKKSDYPILAIASYFNTTESITR
jgi:hypothetical protein